MLCYFIVVFVFFGYFVLYWYMAWRDGVHIDEFGEAEVRAWRA